MGASSQKSNPILESILLALLIHAVVLVIIYFSDEGLFSSGDKKSPSKDAQIEFIELTEELLKVEEEEPQDNISALIDKYKNVTAKAGTEVSNQVSNYFNKSKVDQNVLEELKQMEKEEFEKLKKEGQIPEDLNQDDIPDNLNQENPENNQTKPNNSGTSSYSAATSEFDFSRDPDFRRNPTYKCQLFGQIVVEITVDRDGHVISANAVSGDLDKSCLKTESENYAKRWKFAAKFDAPKSERGSITFTFLPQ